MIRVPTYVYVCGAVLSMLDHDDHVNVAYCFEVSLIIALVRMFWKYDYYFVSLWIFVAICQFDIFPLVILNQ